MGRMPHLVKERKKAKRLGEPRIIRSEEFEGYDIDTRLEMIRALIPIGIMAIYEELDQEVVKLAGARHSRKQGKERYYLSPWNKSRFCKVSGSAGSRQSPTGARIRR